MDDQTLIILAIQLTALTGIVGSLLLYLLCKVRSRNHTYDSDFTSLNVGTGRSVLLTSCDTGFGLQLALHLSALGFRVFAGFKPAGDEEGETCGDSDAVKILRAKVKHREALAMGGEGVVKGVTYGSMITLPLDVTREDSLHEAVNTVRRHLPAGEDGLWAVVNTAGVCYKGRLEQQDSCHWDAMLKVNVVGTLRTARAFLALLRNKQGRLINIGGGGEGETVGGGGLVAYSAARAAVAGAAAALRTELGPLGVRVITLHTDPAASERLFLRPRVPTQSGETDQTAAERYLRCSLQVVSDHALEVLEEALLSPTPRTVYPLSQPAGLSNYMAAITERFSQAHCRKKGQQTMP